MFLYHFRIRKFLHFAVEIPKLPVNTSVGNIKITIGNPTDAQAAFNKIKNFRIYFYRFHSCILVDLVGLASFPKRGEQIFDTLDLQNGSFQVFFGHSFIGIYHRNFKLVAHQSLSFSELFHHLILKYFLIFRPNFTRKRSCIF